MCCGLICIGHKPAEVGLPIADLFLSSIQLGVLNEIVTDDERLIGGVPAGILSEYSQLFMLNENRHLVDRFDYLYLYQYRKFLARTQGSLRASNRPYIFLVDGERVSDYLLQSIPNDINSKQLIGRPIRLQQTLIEFYQKYHVLSDLLNFMSVLIDTSVLDPAQCVRMLTRTVMIPAPALGLFEKQKLFDILDRLQAAWNAFAWRHYVARTGFQRRVGGFLLERLHSDLLMLALEERESTFALGYQFVVSADPVIEATQ